ncbi:hypothetical protein FJTKL_06482 [Diaporthe vaccinii]|uniref:Beta-lactamase-related domain-containing protein n=1 Tax=Diaporthe vaccinii TaxID=105482 RepID=A0ABR4EX04_9PEZI
MAQTHGTYDPKFEGVFAKFKQFLESVVEAPATIDELCNVELITSKLAKQAPRWEPGSASGYHSWTYGFFLGEVVRRKTGLSLTEFVSQRIAGPLDADFQIGAAEKDWPRVAELIPPPAYALAEMSNLDPESMMAKMLYPFSEPAFSATPQWRKAEIGAANGHTNSQALARIWSNALTIGDESKRLLSKDTIDLIFKEQSYGPDLCMGIPVRFGIGLGIRGNGDAIIDSWVPEGRICFWGGWGGSVVINDLDRHMTIGYAMNKMEMGTAGNTSVRAYVDEIYKALGASPPTKETVDGHS